MPRVELSNIMESDKKSEKQRAWENKLKELDEAADMKGNGLDERIKEVVAAFNVNGFNTSQSCEGHTDSGHRGAPWVAVREEDRPKIRFVDEKRIVAETAKKYGIIPEEVEHADNNDAWVEAHTKASQNGDTEEFKVWIEKNKILAQKIEKTLEDFYRERAVEQDIKLILDGGADGAGSYDVHNGGEDYTEVKEMSDEQKNELGERLLKYREEMDAFGIFLKDKFFKSR